MDKNSEKIFNKSSIMALTFGALNVADYVTTKKILKTGGKELNPIVNFFIKKKCFGIVKIITTLFCMGMIYKEEDPKNTSKILVGLYSAIVSNNIKEIIQHKKEIKK